MLVDTKPDMKVVREEIFGPVLVAIPFKEVDDKLIATANDTIYGLAAGVWSRDIAKANQLANALKAGSVWVNCYHVFDAALPFGGYKQSGWGREMGQAVLSNYLEAKAITSRIWVRRSAVRRSTADETVQWTVSSDERRELGLAAVCSVPRVPSRTNRAL